MRGKIKRYIALVLCVLMCVGAAGPVEAAKDSRRLVMLFGKTKEGNKYTYSTVFSTDFFAQKNSLKTAHSGLAELSACMAMASYGYSVKRLFWSTDVNDTTKMLKKCGFTNTKVRFSKPSAAGGHSRENDWNHATVYTGKQYMSDGTLLVAVVINGYSDGAWEWVSNFNLGHGTLHEGFAMACSEIVSILEDDLTAEGVRQDKVKLWITGHSRGAALTNMVAIKMNTRGYSLDNIYAYGFATPQYTCANIGEYGEAIINFVSPHDFVPYVAPSEWGYFREGTNIIFSEDYADEMEDYYYELYADTYKGYAVDEREDLISEFVTFGGNRDAYYSQIVSRVRLFKRYVRPVDYAMYGIGYAMNNNAIKKASGIDYMISCDDLESVLMTAALVEGATLNPKIDFSHRMQTYICWIKAWEDDAGAVGSGDGVAGLTQTGNLSTDYKKVLFKAMQDEILRVDDEYVQKSNSANDYDDQNYCGQKAITDYLRICATALDTVTVNDFSEQIEAAENLRETGGFWGFFEDRTLYNEMHASMEYLRIIATELDIDGSYAPYIDAAKERFDSEIVGNTEDYHRCITALYRSCDYLEVITYELDQEDSPYYDAIVGTMELSVELDEAAEDGWGQLINGTYRTADLYYIMACEISEDTIYMPVLEQTATDYMNFDEEAENGNDQIVNGIYTGADLMSVFAWRLSEILYGTNTSGTA